MSKIAIVNQNDVIIGAMSRDEARAQGAVYRVVRVLISNAEGKILLQKRSAIVKDSPNKWDFSVSGHVDEGEEYEQAAHREVKEEIGMTSLSLQPLAKFYSEGEHDGHYLRRFNMVYTAVTDQTPQLNLAEVAEVRWMTSDDVVYLIENHPEMCAATFAGKYSALVSAAAVQ